MDKSKEILISVRNLKKYYPVRKGVFKRIVAYVKAVDDVSFDIYRGEIVGVVGESGCGKTTLGKTLIKLIEAESGDVEYNIDGELRNIFKFSKKEDKDLKHRMQIVFQNPYSSLNPSFTIKKTMEEPLRQFKMKAKDRKKKVESLLETVNLNSHYMERYPNEFSGGQRQRIGIARALSVNPEFIVCDESVSALDVSIQAQILELLLKLREEKDLTYMFITHDLSVVEYISDRIIVMYLGKIVELAETEELFDNPIHPYTNALLSAIPVADINKRRKRIPLQGDVPSPVNPPSGCPFHPRCSKCSEICKTKYPKARKFENNGKEHIVYCHFAEKFNKNQ